MNQDHGIQSRTMSGYTVMMIVGHRFRMRQLLQALQLLGLTVIAVLSSFPVCAQEGPAIPDRDPASVLWVRRVEPLLREKCWACHGADPSELLGGLDLTTADGLRTGGDSDEPAVVPGEPETSSLWMAVSRAIGPYSAMPPKEADRLSDQELTWIQSWIRGGAPWPDQAERQRILEEHSKEWEAEDGIRVKTRSGQTAAWNERRYRLQDLWAYRPLATGDMIAGPRSANSSRRKDISGVQETGGGGLAAEMDPGNAIDLFLAARRPPNLTVAPRADRETLIRRATFDLTGLPPLPGEVEAFLNDPDSDTRAFAKLVERLLASPHYGERMAQHWLDVVRYADSAGLANDYERGNAWRYRDYVVRSFNADKPYDQFVREQIAGDEMDPDNPEALIATGFLRMGPWELTGMEVARVARQQFLDDVTNSVGETFLAQSLQCARCHDHKFDPVPTVDYYAIQAVFATTQLAERPAPFLPQENLHGFEERVFLERQRQEHLATLRQLDQRLLNNAQQWFEEHEQTNPEASAMVATWRDRWNALAVQLQGSSQEENGSVFAEIRRRLLQDQVDENHFPPKLYGFTPADYGLQRVASKGLERLRWEMERYEPYALAVYAGRTPELRSISAPLRMPAEPDIHGELEQTCVLLGGDPFSLGDPVAPGTLSIVEHLSPPKKLPGQAGSEGDRVTISESIHGRREAFARWVTDPANPLTTRAMVNRIWLWHFGRPLAGNPNNFGATGARPTHPELLDWLAASFVEAGWSVKAIHRLIMNSAAYCRSGHHPDRAVLEELDPGGASYAVFHPRRLSAEELRDAMLVASGEINREMGGIPSRPEIHPEVALQPRQVMGAFASAWVPHPLPRQRHRRSLYTLKIRGLRDPFREVFNEPSPDFSCEQRESSLVTPQVFSLFNGQATYDRALAMAHRVLREMRAEADSDDEAIRTCFRYAFGRSATRDELELCRAHWHALTSLREHVSPVPSPWPVRVEREAVEENTGEKFLFTQRLYAVEDFVPDLQPADVDPRTRALADVCLALLNSHEFLYVY